LRVRQNELRRLLRTDSGQHHEPLKNSQRLPPREIDPSIPPEDMGWRYRTVLVRNIPPALRTEQAIADYFEHHFRNTPPVSPDSTSPSTPENKDSYPMTSRYEKDRPKLITTIVLVRRQAELNAMYAKYMDVLHELETAHVQLARNVMKWAEIKARDQELAKDGLLPPISPFEWTKLHTSSKTKKAYELEHSFREGDEVLLSSLKPFLSSNTTPPLDLHGNPMSIWTVLHHLQHDHPNLLDRFHPLKRLSRFKNQSVPAIDYWLTKLNIQMSLIDDLRARPEQFEAASTAFVTFERVEDAIRAKREMSWRHPRTKAIMHGGKALEFRVKPAPEARDLHWDQLVIVSLHSDLLRGTILQVVIWTGTIIWVS